jgi:hypothetical protein
MIILSVYDKIQNACHQLNADAYTLQVSGRKTKLRHFSPCEKSLVLLACLRENTHFGTAMMQASMTHCLCHNGLSEDGLYAMCFDDTAKKAHYGYYSHNLTCMKHNLEFCVECFPVVLIDMTGETK